MSVHDACTLYAGGCLRNISSVAPWYPLVGIPIGVNSPHSARLGHPSRLKIATVFSVLYFCLSISDHNLSTFRYRLTGGWSLTK